MLCHSAVGACQIYVPGWVISIHYHDGYCGTKGDIVSFSFQLHNSCLSSSHPNLGKIIPQTRTADYTSEFIWDVEKRSLISASYFSSGQTEWEGDFPGCYSCAVKSDACESAPAQQTTRPRTCLGDTVSPSPHLCSTFVLDVLSSADCPPHFRRGLEFCISF